MKRKTPNDPPRAIAAFRVPAPTGEAVDPPKALPRKGAQVPFVRDVRRALREMEAEAMVLLSTGASRSMLRLPVSSVVRRAGRGRSQLYGAFPYLAVEIAEADARLRSAAKSAGKRVPKSKERLARELRATTTEAKRKVAVLASTQLADLVKRLGPEFRRRERLVAEVAELRQRLEEAEMSKKMLSELQKSWMVEANRRTRDD